MDKKLYLALILVRALPSGMQILAKVAFAGGMSTFVFVFYRQTASFIFMAPIALISERKRSSSGPRMPFKPIFRAFLLALAGVTLTSELYTVALDYTSPAMVAAAVNTVPAFTYLLAVLLGMETVRLKSPVGVAKILGVVLCLAGSLVLAFYQGPLLKSPNHHHLLGRQTGAAGRSGSSWSSGKKWVEGCFIMLLCSICWSSWIVFQAVLLKQYPSKELFTAHVDAFAMVDSFLVALVFERDFSRWKLGLDLQLLSVAYSGFVVTGFSFYLQSWCIERGGPVVLAMSTPLSFVITVSCLSFVFGEPVASGSVVGGALMVVGLYSVLWGKNTEQEGGHGGLPVSGSDGKEDLRMEEQPPSLDETARTSNLEPANPARSHAV